MARKSKSKKLVIILFICLVIIGLLVYLLDRADVIRIERFEDEKMNVSKVLLPEGATNNNEAVIKAMSQTAYNMLNTIRPAQQGPPGPPGAVGPRGKSGGLAQVYGPLRPLSDTSIVAERLFGSCPNGKVVLNTQTFEPQQTWTLQADGQLQNQYGNAKQCLAVNGKGGICMIPCSSNTGIPPPELRWTLDGSGRLVSFKRDGNDKVCLTVEEGNFKGSPKISEKQAGKKGVSQSYQNMKHLVAKKCEVNPKAEQRWAFY